jgi:hypothetical protein
MHAIKKCGDIPRSLGKEHDMMSARSLLAAFAMTVGAWINTTTTQATEELALPAGARVGIIVMMQADLTHFHVARSRTASFMRTYPISWPVSEVVDDPIAAVLHGMGFEPVFLDPSPQLWRQRQEWIISERQSDELPRAADEEIARILEAEKLEALIIVAPGLNTDPEPIEGNRLRKLPTYVQGWGFSTSDDAEGITRPVVFNLTQMLIIGRTDELPDLIFREWGGAFLYEWAGFQPGDDVKALSAEEVSRFRPVMEDILQKQIARFTPVIKIADKS